MPTLRQLFLQHVAQTSDAPLAIEIEQAEGMHLYATDGRKYLDLIAGIGVSALGHGNSAVKEAIRIQSEKHLHLMVYGELIQNPQVALAQKLVEHLPASIDSIYFTNSGTEAVEGAMKLARRATGRKKFVAFKSAYHGSTQGALSLMSPCEFREPFEPLIEPVEFLDADAENPDLSQIDSETAAVFAEPVRGESGYLPMKPCLMQALRERCTKMGALLVFDEIQCGMGRTGSLWAFSQYHVEPDILLSAKALGGGLPLGAFMANSKLMSTLAHNPPLGHITTFGGHPLSCAAALAGFAFLLKSNLIAEVKEKEDLFRALLEDLPYPISGRGLMLAIDFRTPEACQKIIRHLLDDGILSDWFLFAPQKLRMAPPLIISHAEIALVCERILIAASKI